MLILELMYFVHMYKNPPHRRGRLARLFLCDLSSALTGSSPCTPASLSSIEHSNHPITTVSSVGKSYAGISRFKGAGPLLTLPLMS